MASKTGSAASIIIACVIAWFFIVLVAVLRSKRLELRNQRQLPRLKRVFRRAGMVYVRAIASVP
jgi:uncharacterized membrane protein YccC